LSDVKTVVETFIDKVSQYTCIPYIVCCSYGKIPDDHQKFIEGLKNLDETEEKIKENSEASGPPSDEGTTDDRIKTFFDVKRRQITKEPKK
jgi:hypothetical protein